MSTFRTIVSASALSLSLVLASGAAFAGEKDGAGKLTFPVAATTYKQHVEARLEKRKAHLEERITSGKIPADKAAEVRARFAEERAKVSAAVEKAVADGNVTAEEAKEVRQAGGGHGRGCGGEGGGKGKGRGAGAPKAEGTPALGPAVTTQPARSRTKPGPRSSFQNPPSPTRWCRAETPARSP